MINNQARYERYIKIIIPGSRFGPVYDALKKKTEKKKVGYQLALVLYGYLTQGGSGIIT